MSIDYAEAARLIKKGRRSEQRGKAMEGCITGLLTGVVRAFLSGWLFMLAIGWAHNHWWPAVPTIGYWTSVVFMALMPSLGSNSSTSKSD